MACKEGAAASQGWHGARRSTCQTLRSQLKSLPELAQADEAGASLIMHSGQRQLYKDGMSRSSPAISAGAAPQNHHRQASRPVAMSPAQSPS